MPEITGISFCSEDKAIPTVIKSKPSLIKKWLKDLSKTEKKKLGVINFIFCSDKFLITLNKQFLNHHYYTDIISFDYSDYTAISGDIFISLDRVKENAKLLSVPYKTEILRVMAHGVLHLCGYKDKLKSEKTIMRSKENFYLDKFTYQ
jgi:rRNA maturation RNase YbeY